MFRVRYMAPDELPPKPDPVTGLPRPPRGPRLGKRERDPRLDPDRATEPALAPEPPSGQGPVLAWYRENRQSRWKTGATAAVLMIVIFTIGMLGVGWMQYWWAWLLIFVGAVLIGRGRGLVQPSAGAEWFQQWGGGWVRTYELTKVTAVSWPTGIAITMTDRDGRSVNVAAFDLVEDPLIMDLVYNGILHSVVAGHAQTNGALHFTLRVPYPKAAERRSPLRARRSPTAASRPRGKRSTRRPR